LKIKNNTQSTIFDLRQNPFKFIFFGSLKAQLLDEARTFFEQNPD